MDTKALDTIPHDTLQRFEPEAPLSVVQLKSRLKAIQDVMREVMDKGADYGVIPGTEKPTLYKPGAEKLCVTFRLSAEDPLVEELPTFTGGVRYRVRVPIRAAYGALLAVGVGECSTDEEKYAWRRPVHENEYLAAPEDRRREKYQRDGNVWRQVRVNPADVANTVLKMAHKRAYVHAVIMATAAGAIFTQDIEDLPDGVESPDAQAKAPTPAPQRKPDPPAAPAAARTAAPSTDPVISEPQAKRFYAIAMNAGWTADELKAWLKREYDLDSDREIPRRRYDEIVKACQDASGN